MISTKQKILFFENLGNLINAGIPVIQALNIIIYQTKNKSLKNLTISIKKDIEAGENLFKVSLKNKKVFSVFDMAMLEAGESIGKVGKALEIISQKEEKDLNLKNKITQAMIYPIAIVVVTMAMITVMMIYVIPKIETIYRDANTNLPGLTKAVISFSHIIRDDGLYILGFLVFLIIGSAYLLKLKNIKIKVDKAILNVPIFGDIIKKKILVNFADFLSTLLSSGIMINKAILILKNGTTNLYYAKEYEKILENIKNGKTLSSSMGGNLIELNSKKALTPEEKINLKMAEESSILFPIELTTSIKIGEQTGTLSKMLERSSARYTKEIDHTVKNLSTMLEPIIIVVIGAVVGTIIMAILLPFLSIGDVIK